MKKTLILLATLANITLIDSLSATCCFVETRCPGGRFYVGGFGGFNWTDKNGHRVPRNPVPQTSSNTSPENTSPQPHMSLRDWHPGYAVGGSVGYAWNNGFKLEVEGSFRHNKRKGDSSTKGNHQSGACLANALYQFNMWCWPLDVYFGVGAGYVNCYHRHHNTTSNDRDGFAWQFIGGVAVPFLERMELTVDYRYFTEQRAKFRNNAVTAGLRFYM
jgi:opacity protein-like surface antigen